jgi:hypothetical protein
MEFVLNIELVILLGVLDTTKGKKDVILATYLLNGMVCGVPVAIIDFD